MDRLPAEMVKIIAAHAGFFDRGFTTSRDLPEWAKSKYEVDEVTVAAPPSWLAAMPDSLSMPDGSATGHDYIGRMSLVVSERACVVKA